MNRVSERDTIKAVSLDKNGKVIASLYDSGFRNISQIISAIIWRGAGWLQKTHSIQIKNEDKEWCATYDKHGRKIN